MLGISKLKKRVQDNSIVVMETDKSGKLAVASMEAYLEMGQVHIKNDEEVGEEEGGHVKALVEVSVEAFVVCRSLLIRLKILGLQIKRRVKWVILFCRSELGKLI